DCRRGPWYRWQHKPSAEMAIGKFGLRLQEDPMTRDAFLPTPSTRGLPSGARDPLEDTSRRLFLQRLAKGTLIAIAGPAAADWLANDTKASCAGLAGPAAGPPLSPHIKGRTPFAVILCRFNDLPALSIPQSEFADFFSGAGKGGVCDYYKDISYGT